MCVFLQSANQWTGFFMIKDLRHERAKGLFLIQSYFFALVSFMLNFVKTTTQKKKIGEINLTTP